jgi:hypothetical protein
VLSVFVCCCHVFVCSFYLFVLFVSRCWFVCWLATQHLAKTIMRETRCESHFAETHFRTNILRTKISENTFANNTLREQFREQHFAEQSLRTEIGGSSQDKMWRKRIVSTRGGGGPNPSATHRTHCRNGLGGCRRQFVEANTPHTSLGGLTYS